MSNIVRGFTQRLWAAIKPVGPALSFNEPRSDIYNVTPKKTAEQMINEIKPVEIEANKVGCDGGNGPLGHPMVYINLDSEKPVPCGYCGLRFVKKHGHHHH
ncbi:hypothetical protein CYY_004586 [Polysphondylium violaceum]|uniref:Zinc finger CHCC-type domain-containing protein n=1 Tax=Polysphondylium violaceum TaxID=133409 RepID=A0A8J4USW9_9MYCE|nr:hypothetical protein CYY_004586 [Polysphondylium violaceum]